MGAPVAFAALTMLVIDASVAVAACVSADGWEIFGSEHLVAPALLLSEACSALHESRWRGDLSPDLAQAALLRLAEAPLELRGCDGLQTVWSVAEEFGWAKTYDAEYVALARSLECPLVTLDDRLRRGVRGKISVIGPSELPPLDPA